MISGIDSTSAAASAASTAGNSLAKNFDTFLKLLTTQLQNQDPLSPLDAKDFTQQLVQFSSVEQAIATNKNLEKLLSLVQTGYSANLVNYLGKTVEVSADAAALANGSATWSYALDGAASKVELGVYDSANRLVWSGAGDGAAGRHDFVWDGLSTSGVAQPDGNYRLVVRATDTQGETVESQITVQGLVTAVDSTGDEATLTVNGRSLPLADVLSVRMAGV